MRRSTVAIANRIDEMARVFAAMERLGDEGGLPRAVVNDLNLVLDEVLNNVISYAYDDTAEHRIEIELELGDDGVVIVVSDDGRPFDPLQAPPPALESTLKKRRSGGLGIHFMRKLMDQCGYVRVDGCNRLTMKKRVTRGDREG